jgi:hypothetical protein
MEIRQMIKKTLSNRPGPRAFPGPGRGRNRRRNRPGGAINTILSFVVTAAVHDLMKKDSVIKDMCSRAVNFITGRSSLPKDYMLDNNLDSRQGKIIEVDAELIEEEPKKGKKI